MQSTSGDLDEGGQGFGGGQSGGDASAAQRMKRSDSKTLRQCGAREDITDTVSLVAAYNSATDSFELKALGRWLNCYIEWFSNQTVAGLTEEAMSSYASLANIMPRRPEAQDLLKRFFFSICNKIRRQYYGDRMVVRALEFVLRSMDLRALEKDPTALLRLADDLLMRLSDVPIFTRNTYPTHGPTLLALRQTFVAVQQVSPEGLGAAKEGGVYEMFKQKLKMIRESQEYYPFAFYAKLIEESIERLTTPLIATASGAIGRLLSGVAGSLWLYRGVKGIVREGIDVDALEKGCKSLGDACKARPRSQVSWYDMLEWLSASIAVGCQDSNKTEVFEQCCSELVDVERAMQDGEETQALRFGIVELLREAVDRSTSRALHEIVVRDLVCIGHTCLSDERWKSDISVCKALLDALQAACAYGDGDEVIFDALNVMFSDRDGGLKIAFDEWLGDETIERKLGGSHTSPREPEVDSLFRDTRAWLGIIHSNLDAIANTEDLRSRYGRHVFAAVSSLFEKTRTRWVTDFEHELVLYKETWTKDDREGEKNKGDKDAIPSRLEDQTSANDERRRMVKISISQRDLFKQRALKPNEPLKNVRVVLLYGNPGTGKTIVGRKIAYGWATHTWGSEFATTYLVPMREANAKRYNDGGLRNARTLETVIANICFTRRNKEDTYEALKTHIEEELELKTTLLILDGLDESDEFGKDIVRDAVQRGCKLLLLSRPYNLQEEREAADIEVECIGMNDSQLERYIVSELGEDGGLALMKYLRSNPTLWDVGHIPVTAQILCLVSGEKNRGKAVGETGLSLFALYSDMVGHVWERYTDRPGRAGLEGEITFKTLEKIAFDSLNDGQILIGRSLVSKHAAMGASVRVLKECGLLLLQLEGQHFQFPHLTFQEYFAARHLARSIFGGDEMTRATAVDFVSENKYAAKHHVTLHFMMGHVFQNQKMGGFKSIFEMVDRPPRDVVGAQHMLVKMRLLEASLTTISSVSSTSNDQLLTAGRSLSEAMGRLLDVLLAAGEHEFERIASRMQNMPNVFRYYTEHFGSVVSWYRAGIEKNGRYDLEWVPKAAKHSQEFAQQLVYIVKDLCGDGYWEVRRAAVEQIGALTAAVPGRADELCRAVHERCADDHRSVRLAAVEQFGALAAAVPSRADELSQAALEWCGDRDKDVHRAAVEQFGALAAAVPGRADELCHAALEWCGDRDKDVRRTAVEPFGALAAAVPDRADELCHAALERCADDHMSVRLAAVEQFGALAAAVPSRADELCGVALERCGDGKPFVRRAAVEQFGALAAAVPSRADELSRASLERCGDRFKDVRRAAVELIGALAAAVPGRADELCGVALERCGDRDNDVRLAAVKQFGALAAAVPSRADELCRAALERCGDDYYRVRLAAVEQIGALAAAVPGRADELCRVALERCGVDDSEVRQVAVDQIGALAAAVPCRVGELCRVALERCRDRSGDVRMVARKAFESISIENLVKAHLKKQGGNVLYVLGVKFLHSAVTVCTPGFGEEASLVIHDAFPHSLKDLSENDFETLLICVKNAIDDHIPGIGEILGFGFT